ncbi:hypothetical protein [Parafrankia sp. FMc2]|uniref:hypothetical protein n=1 Tax=Parafrankia sp. FMc2 TaxID=3233196 RepID=UPI0034D40BB1
MNVEMVEVSENVRTYTTRTRIASEPGNGYSSKTWDALTPEGKVLCRHLDTTDGIEEFRFGRHSVTVTKTPSKLWPWGEVHQEILRIFNLI